MVRVAKFHDFVSFYICQVPEKSFVEKRKSIFEKSKKLIWQFQHWRVPPLDKNFKKIKIFLFFEKKSYFCTWIWIRNVLSFLLMYIFYLLLKISNFVIICLKNIIFDLCQSGAYNSKRRLYSGLFLVSVESKRSKYLS